MNLKNSIERKNILFLHLLLYGKAKRLKDQEMILEIEAVQVQF